MTGCGDISLVVLPVFTLLLRPVRRLPKDSVSEHEAAIVNKNTGNAMAKHLAIYHKENEGDPDSFEYSSVATFKKNLDRQISEAVSLKYSVPDIVINQKNEHHGAAMHRTTMTRELRLGS